MVFVVAAVLLLPQLAADIHYFFSRQWERLTMNPLDGWSAIIASGKPLQFYLLLSAVVALLLAYILFTGSYLKYRSNMQVITPDIVTPCADGQGQFGTARWLTRDEIGRCFGIWRIHRKDKALVELMKAGERDRKEIRDARI